METGFILPEKLFKKEGKWQNTESVENSQPLTETNQFSPSFI